MNENFVVHSSEKLAMTPALPLVLTTYAELIQSNLAVPFITFNNDSRIIWVEKHGVVIGGIVWEYKPDINCGWIILSFTHKCYKVLEESSKKLGASHLSSFVSINNKSRVDSMNSVGMKPVAYRTHKKL